jgi:hypothetical protein
MAMPWKGAVIRPGVWMAWCAKSWPDKDKILYVVAPVSHFAII